MTLSQKIGATDQRPLWRKEARTHYDQGRIGEAVQSMIKVVNDDPSTAIRDDYALLSLYLFSLGDIEASLVTTDHALTRWPDDSQLREARGILLIRLKRHEDARDQLLPLVAESPANPNLLDALAHACGAAGNLEQAIEFGEASLKAKDKLVRKRPVPALLDRAKPRFDPTQPTRNVIAFSLWGSQPRYTDMAVRNAQLAKHIYPGWTCRFYVDDSVPSATRQALREAGAQMVIMDEPGRLYEGLFWRFAVANDPDIDYFLVRDADSQINIRERAAVMEWLDSPKRFHVMRDWYSHTELILAGLWGGVGGVLPGLSAMWECYLTSTTKTSTCDQLFLRESVWPMIRRDVMIHDRLFRTFRARPFPAFSDLPDNHVGSDQWFVENQATRNEKKDTAT